MPVVYLVPHTHWDREWYEPFQRFRLRLVDLLDGVVSSAEADPAFRFTLDGQTAAIDDYLELRPEREPLVRRLVAEGQLAVGPWRILLDSFLVSGENIIRNLELGRARAEELGRLMPVGYLPDSFGHTAQLPQILRLAGLAHACLWRGVPAEIDRHGFVWAAPDGTAVRVEYLPDGYGNAADLFADPDQLAERAKLFEDRYRGWFGDDDLLAMYGADHSAPVAGLSELVGRLGVDARLATLDEYVTEQGIDGLPEHRGELRSHARANLLPGVLSARSRLKQAMAAAEAVVTRYAEPLAALYGGDFPRRYLDMAWQRLVDSSGHDSITGCGSDDTAQQVAARIAEARQLGEAVRDRVLRELAAEVPADATLVVNPLPTAHTGWVRLEVPVPEEWSGVALELPGGTRVPTQEMRRNTRLLTEETMGHDALPSVFDRVYGQECFNRVIQAIEVDPAGRTLTFHVGGWSETVVPIGRYAEEVRAVAEDGVWTWRVVEEPRRMITAAVPLPPLGWVAARPVEAAAEEPVLPAFAVSNGLVSVEPNGDGSLCIRTPDGVVMDGVGRVVQGADTGDLYNYAPPADGATHAAVESVQVHRIQRSLVNVLFVRREYRWGGERAEVDMVAELNAGDPVVYLAVSFRNPTGDQRLRLHVPLPAVADGSVADGQFAVVERGLVNEGGCGEEPVPTFPAESFVVAGGAAVLTSNVTEYEVVGGGRELALTLLRSVGQISRNVHPYRAMPAGPETPTPDAQQLGAHGWEFGVLPLPAGADWQRAEVPARADAFRYDVLAVPGTGPAGGPLRAVAGLEVTGDGVRMSSLRRHGDHLELRVSSFTGVPTAAVVRYAGLRHAVLVDLRGEELGTAAAGEDGTVEVPLRPWQIATLRLVR
jgi:mannosylglycerate hydrolase